MLSASHVSYRVADHTLLDNVSMELAAGELVMVIGPNGAGKTTLLKCLSGELRPQQGEVSLCGDPVSSWARDELARHRAVLPQHSSLDFPFPVRDVVLLGRIPHRDSEARNREIAEEVLTLCDCAGLEHRLYTSLSGGEQQRVQAARILAQVWGNTAGKGQCLLLDEPVSALDLSHQYGLLELLGRLAAERNFGIVCTLHNLNLVAQFAHRAIVIDRGMIVAEGAPIEVFTEETLGNVFNLDVSIQPHPENHEIPLIVPRLLTSLGPGPGVGPL